MHRTQIYLENGQYEMLRSRARREGKTMASVIRDILADYLSPKQATGSKDSFTQVIGIGRGDGSPVAENFEDYLYGGER